MDNNKLDKKAFVQRLILNTVIGRGGNISEVEHWTIEKAIDLYEEIENEVNKDLIPQATLPPSQPP